MPARNTEPPSDEVLMGRVMSKVSVTGEGCWEYGGAGHKRSGHGMFGYTVSGKTTVFYVHRWVYEQRVGAVPDGLVLDHLCRNPPCCNPEHLEPVTLGTNTLRGEGRTAVNARKTHCKRGHALAGRNLIVHPGKYGQQRQCRECANMTRRRRAAEIRADK